MTKRAHEHRAERVALIGTYVPNRCGIATFGADVVSALASAEVEARVIAIEEGPSGARSYPDEVALIVERDDLEAYASAARFINRSEFDAIVIEHEFGIFGGPDGAHILTLLEHARVPAIITLHTILEAPSPGQERVMRALVRLAERFVVMSQKGAEILGRVWSVEPERIDVIPHGVPDGPYSPPKAGKARLGLDPGRPLILTFGLLGPGKGIETVIRAMPAIVAEHPEADYLVLGATHPNLVRAEGESYREGLVALAAELGVAENVRFEGRYVELDELLAYLDAADLYVTPYPNRAQITSGTLSYALGRGRAVLSTPYWHAEELLADGRGELFDFHDHDALSRLACELLHDEERCARLARAAYEHGRTMSWACVGRSLAETFETARASAFERAQLSGSAEDWIAPQVRWDHVRRMTDQTGLLQHARYAIAHRDHGYCTDDNARALMIVIDALALEPDRQQAAMLEDLQRVYAAFLDSAWDGRAKAFRNFMSFDRRWLESSGSPDSQARALWALGVCAERAPREIDRAWAVQRFELAFRATERWSGARTVAFSLLGFDAFLRATPGHREVERLRADFCERLMTGWRACSAPEWRWVEQYLTYDNARVAQAMIEAAPHHPVLGRAGLEALDWLMREQTHRGVFRPIGSDGFYTRGGERAIYDQQPLEAHASVSACLSAWRLTGERHWLEAARHAALWFAGRNDLGAALYDETSGGCCDGLHHDRVNRNQGAESTLAAIGALLELELAGAHAAPHIAASAIAEEAR